MAESKDQPTLEKIYEGFYMDTTQNSTHNHTPENARSGISYDKGKVPTTNPGQGGGMGTMNSNEEDEANEFGRAILVQLEEYVEKWKNENTNPKVELSIAINDIIYLLKYYKELHGSV
tara:strand:+ start:1376 stop:1729 length:354 start_codon:yes stop_codon:yes gene_type:complete